jgi:hypothetical protein
MSTSGTDNNNNNNLFLTVIFKYQYVNDRFFMTSGRIILFSFSATVVTNAYVLGQGKQNTELHITRKLKA